MKFVCCITKKGLHTDHTATDHTLYSCAKNKVLHEFNTHNKGFSHAGPLPHCPLWKNVCVTRYHVTGGLKSLQDLILITFFLPILFFGKGGIPKD